MFVIIICEGVCKLRKIDRQVVVSLAAVVFGLALLLYGADMHRIDVYSQDGTTVTGSRESAVVKEVTIGGVKRDEEGKIKQTYTGKAPEACPT